MIRSILSLATVLAFVFPQVEAYAQYDMSSAVTLALNSSANGSMAAPDGSYWWKVTTDLDGSLAIETNSGSSLEIDLSMYDESGNYLAGNAIGSGTRELSRMNNAGAGTYYIKAIRWYGEGSYTISSTSTPTSQENDPERNDDADSALVLAPTGNDSGHLGYYEPGREGIDSNDWWVVTTTFDGALTVETFADSTLDIDLTIYDQDKTTYLSGNDIGTGPDERTHHYSLAEGTYYIKAHRWSGYGSYAIGTTFDPTDLANDTESNDTAAEAQVLPANGEDTGHLGYSLDTVRDIDDWWVVTVPSDGALRVSANADSTLDIDLTIYDQNKTTYLSGNDIGTGPDERTHHYSLAAGTYYIKAHRWSGYGSYTIGSTFDPTDLANDTESNDTAAEARMLPANGEDTGHLGYSLDTVRDIDDWWAVTVPSDGALRVTANADSTLDIDMTMYDQDKTAYLSGNDIGTGPDERTHRNNLEAGTYYIKAHRWSGYGSYTIASEFTPAAYASDPEPNGDRETASSLAAGGTVTGHLGHVSLGSTDTDDYYAVTVPAGWDSLYVHSLSDSTLEVDISLYNEDGSTVKSAGSYGVHEILKWKVTAAGTYYVKLHRWSGYGSYAAVAGPAYAEPVVDGIGSIAGTVSNSVDGQRIPGALITLSPGDYSIAADDTGSFRFIDIPTANYTLTVSGAGFSDSVMDVALSDGGELEYTIALVPADVSVDAEPPLAFTVSSPYPNPFNPATTIAFTIPEESAVRITVYDMLGRVVRVLANGCLSAGAHDVMWDGCDDAGNRAGSGVYLYSLRAGAHSVSGRMTLLR